MRVYVFRICFMSHLQPIGAFDRQEMEGSREEVGYKRNI